MNNSARSHGLWEASAPPAPRTRALAGDVIADVAIVGAGFTGLSAALHLAADGHDVVVLEAEEIGFGGSGRNVGLVNAGMWVMPDELPRLLGKIYGPRLLQQLSHAPDLVFELIEKFSIECQAVRAGTLHCAVDAKGLSEIRARAQQWQRLGAPVELLDGEQTRQAVGSRAYRGSLLDRRAGTIQPLAYARGLASAAMASGARIHTKTAVVGADDLGAAWKVRTLHGSVTTPSIIVASNAYSSDAWSRVGEELVRLPYFNLATRPLPAALLKSVLPSRYGIWDTRGILSSLRMDKDGRMVFGSVGALKGTGAIIHRDWGRRALVKLFPQVEKVGFEHEWYGWIGMTSDALPRFHRLARNTISISGYNGRGIAPGTTFGRDLAQLVSGQINESDLSLPLSVLVSQPFKAAREIFYDVGSQAAHLVGARLPR